MVTKWGQVHRTARSVVTTHSVVNVISLHTPAVVIHELSVLSAICYVSYVVLKVRSWSRGQIWMALASKVHALLLALALRAELTFFGIILKLKAQQLQL